LSSFPLLIFHFPLFTIQFFSHLNSTSYFFLFRDSGFVGDEKSGEMV
jgi:hypothetical protein